jgi:hypothetical protein
MRKTSFCLSLLLGLIPLLSQAQPRPMEERVEALRIAFFTEKLQLTPEESQNFWPLYNEYQDKEKSIRKSFRDDKSLELMSDAEAEKLIESTFDMEEKLLVLKKEYYQKMRKVLPVRKVALLSRIERQFKERLLEEWRNRQQDRQQTLPRRNR